MVKARKFSHIYQRPLHALYQEHALTDQEYVLYQREGA